MVSFVQLSQLDGYANLLIGSPRTQLPRDPQLRVENAFCEATVAEQPSITVPISVLMAHSTVRHLEFLPQAVLCLLQQPQFDSTDAGNTGKSTPVRTKLLAAGLPRID